MVPIVVPPISEALAGLGSTRHGLSPAEADRRFRQFGPNRIEQLKRASWPLRLLGEFFQFFSIILWVAAALAFVAEISSPGEGMARIGCAIIIVILVSGLFSFWQEHRNEQTMAALARLLPQEVKVVREGKVFLLPAECLVVGDIVLLEAGDSAPADLRLVEAVDFRINDAAITGESLPKTRVSEPSQDVPLPQARNVVLAGSSVISGHGRGLVFATGARTEFGKIAHLTQTSTAGVTPMRRELARLSHVIAALAIAVGVGFFAVGAAIGLPFWRDLIFSIGIIVAMVPEGLQATLTLSLVLAAQRLARRKVLIRHLSSVETLGSATVICTDKTGTLTENRMRVRELFVGLEDYPVAAATADTVLVARERHFFSAMALTHHLQELQTGHGTALAGDPMERALVDVGCTAIGRSDGFRRVDEVAFDSDRMRHSVVYETDCGRILYCKGAPETVMGLCRSVAGSATTTPLDPDTRARIVAAQESMAGRGRRVLAYAMQRVSADTDRLSLECDMTFLGLVGLEDPPRPDVPDAIARCRDASIKVVMVTGDHPDTARAIAAEIGLVRSASPSVLTGPQVDTLSEADLKLALDAPELIFARVSASQKLRIVEALKARRHIVAVTGDGINDAPALKSANIGIAMGLSGTDVAKQASDMILLDDNFSGIVSAIEEGRTVFQNIRKFLTYVLVHNVAELVPFLAFGLFRVPLALTPIQALSIDMATDSLTALGLGIERAGPSIMALPPRSQAEPLLNARLAVRAYLFLGLIEAVGAMAAFFLVLRSGGWQWGQALSSADPLYLRATTACLSAIIILQIVNVFICRSSVRSVFAMSPFDNRLILIGIAFEIALLIAFNYTALGNVLLQTASVSAAFWVLIGPAALSMLAAEEIRKWLVRRSLSSDRRIAGTRAPTS
ncbi:cation-transporting P-type ATPase [Bradyrhizobium sp.]|uniref:cation-translocating P-type ATPase n=1 Tax=Bradyrhizobium sp. TaxID=376 RepID=UPI00239D6820|nr:cation-transporting P-type ATPase [Bradyrhizobium sp.]MDE2378312.1 cation-transporting P-type ATPase [Bradyrhizobium sp.]